jgi:tRNA(His) guanylyltransferase
MGTPLKSIPSFDSRTVLYPSDRALRDYLSWRQVDCHINNLYNTCFWALVNKASKTQREAENILKVRSIFRLD